MLEAFFEEIFSNDRDLSAVIFIFDDSQYPISDFFRRIWMDRDVFGTRNSSPLPLKHKELSVKSGWRRHLIDSTRMIPDIYR